LELDDLAKKIGGGAVTIEERLDRLEQLVVQLVHMVGENNKIVKDLSQRMDRLEQRMDRLEQRMDKIEQRMDKLEQRMDKLEQRFDEESALNRLRHQEVIKEVRNLNFEVDYLRNQTSKHDMEIHKIKQLQAASN
jgi:chromosome segregation ATPase